MSVHEDCGYEQAAHADFRVDGKCVIDLPDETPPAPGTLRQEGGVVCEINDEHRVHTMWSDARQQWRASCLDCRGVYCFWVLNRDGTITEDES